MKNTLSLLLLLLLPLCGIGQKYTIQGILPEDSSKGLYILLIKKQLYGEKMVVIDSVRVKKGRFFFKGRIEEPCLVNLLLSGGENLPGSFILEPGEIKLTFHSKGLVEGAGTPLNEEYYNMIVKPLSEVCKISDDTLVGRRSKAMVQGEGEWTVDDEIKYRETLPIKEWAVLEKKRWEFIAKYLHFPEVIIDEFYSYYNQNESDSRVQKIIFQLPEHIVIRMREAKVYIKKDVEEYIKKYGKPKGYTENTPEAVKVGKPFSDFSGETPDGKQVTLSEVVKNNKLVLIDFWASWCGPCMEEMPNIAELYRQYKDKGLEIIGISSDQSAQRWTETIQKRNMIWPQIRSAGEDRIGSTYGVEFIPYTILIDHNGTIIARRLRGDELQQKIKDILQ